MYTLALQQQRAERMRKYCKATGPPEATLLAHQQTVFSPLDTANNYDHYSTSPVNAECVLHPVKVAVTGSGNITPTNPYNTCST